MAGVAGVYLVFTKGRSEEASQYLSSLFQRKQKSEDLQKFVVLSWKFTGSNLLCSNLYNLPEIIMHNELFNPIDIIYVLPCSVATV